MALPASFNIFHQVPAEATSYRSTVEIPAARRHGWLWRTIYNGAARTVLVGLISPNRLMRIARYQCFVNRFRPARRAS